MKLLTKLLSIPFGSRSIEAVQLWEVRWTSRHGAYHSDTKPEMEAFTTEASALAFAKALRDAFKLVKHTSGNSVTVKHYHPQA